MKTWLISDTHFGEQPKRRRAQSGLSGDELDAQIRRNWLAQIGSDDLVWHLGDIGRDWRQLEGLPGTKKLVLAHASDRRPAIKNSGLFSEIVEHVWLEHGGSRHFMVHNPDQPRLGPDTGVIHGHHHYRAPDPGNSSVCVDHHGWAPIELDALLKTRGEG